MKPTLTVRKVDIDFSDAKIHWNPAWPEYAALLNGLSSGFPELEPFLCKVLNQAKDKAPPEMRRDVEMLISQEARHYKQHIKFNKLLYDAGYELKPVIETLAEGYKRSLADKPLKFNLGYCDGFETFGPMLSYFFFDHAPGADLMKDWDEPTVYLWLWHLSEEFEHRSVCYELYKAIYGDYSSYLYRIYMMWYSMVNLFGYGLKAYKVIITKDRETMNRRERLASKVRFSRVFWRLASFIVKHMVTKCMRRGYDPSNLLIPEKVTFWLDETSQRYGILESA